MKFKKELRLRVTEEMYNKIKSKAGLKDLTVSEIVRELLENNLTEGFRTKKE